jgi:hypothetical protein
VSGEFVKISPPERRRRPSYYSADELHAMLVDDAVKHRPPGGRGQKGLQWFTEAVALIAKERRQQPEVAWVAILDDIEARTGRRWVAVG